MSGKSNRVLWSLGVGVWAAVLASSSPAQIVPDEVLVCVNDSSAISVAVGAYYQNARSIPADNMFHLPAGTTTAETISRDTYNTEIRDAFVQHLTVTKPYLQDQIKAIVLTKGVPTRVANSGGSGTNISAASVDSELTQLFTGNVGDSGHQGRLINPMFGTYKVLEKINHANISYAVFRLEGYQTDIDPDSGVPEDIQRLIDDAQNPAGSGTILLDASGATGQGNGWMIRAAEILTEMGIPNTLDTTSVFQSNHPDLLGYCSWGSNDPSDAGPPYYGEVPPGSGNFYPGTFLPGATTTTYVSTSARTFLDGNQNYGQSLIVDLVDIGAAAANGHTYEPYLDAVARPQLLFPHFHQGLQLGNAYYQSIQWLSWENIVVCDPLMTTPMVGLLMPEFTRTIPDRIPAGADFSGLKVEGEHFTGIHDMKVKVNDVRCAKLDVVSTQLATCDVKPTPPGMHTLRIKTFMGAIDVAKAVIVTPAMDLTGTPDLGQQVTLSIRSYTQDAFMTFWSLGTTVIPTPYGDLLLDPSQGFYLLISGVLLADDLDLTGTIPNDPILSGVTIYFQSLVGADLQTQGRFTNLITMAIP